MLFLSHYLFTFIYLFTAILSLHFHPCFFCLFCTFPSLFRFADTYLHFQFLFNFTSIDHHFNLFSYLLFCYLFSDPSIFLSDFNFFLCISFWFFQSFSGLQTHVCIFRPYLFLHLFISILAFLLFISDPFSSDFFLYMYFPVSHYYHGMPIACFVFSSFVPIFIFTILSPSPFLPSHIYFHIFIFNFYIYSFQLLHL